MQFARLTAGGEVPSLPILHTTYKYLKYLQHSTVPYNTCMSTSKMKGYDFVGTLNNPNTDLLVSVLWKASTSAYVNNTPE